MKKLVLLLMLTAFVLYGCGKTNFFSWAHKKGSDENTEALTADGDKAMIDKDYDSAYEYYSKAIEKNSKNSLARYGRARANYGKAGLSVSSLLASALEESKTTSNAMTTYALLTSGAKGDNLIPNMDFTKLYIANKQVITDLKEIADGNCDGIISANDPDVNINLAFSMVIQSALFLMDSNKNEIPNETADVIKVLQDYTISYPAKATMDGYSAETKANIKSQVKEAIVYIKGSAGASILFDYGKVWKGALEYMDVALNSGSIQKKGSLDELKNNFNKLYENTDSANTGLVKFWEDVKNY